MLYLMHLLGCFFFFVSLQSTDLGALRLSPSVPRTTPSRTPQRLAVQSLAVRDWRFPLPSGTFKPHPDTARLPTTPKHSVPTLAHPRPPSRTLAHPRSPSLTYLCPPSHILAYPYARRAAYPHARLHLTRALTHAPPVAVGDGSTPPTGSWISMFDDGLPLTTERSEIQWLYSVYWALTTLTTVGYGDITPQNNTERWAIGKDKTRAGCGGGRWRCRVGVGLCFLSKLRCCFTAACTAGQDLYALRASGRRACLRLHAQCNRHADGKCRSHHCSDERKAR